MLPMAIPLLISVATGLCAVLLVWSVTGGRRGGDGRLVVHCHHRDGERKVWTECATV
jgi:hypothetical protein